MKGPMFFFFERSTLRKTPSFLSLHQPRTSHEYHLCILAMYRKDLKQVNRLSLAQLPLPVLKCEAR